MQRPRYREAAPGGSGPGGGSGAAWNGTCGRPRRGTGSGTAGGEEDESGERDTPVPEPGSVPSPEGVPKLGTPRSVPSPEGVPKLGTSGSVPNPEGVPEGVPKLGTSRSVPNTESVPKSGSVPNSGTVPGPWSVPTPESVTSPGGISAPRGVPSPGSVPSPEGVPNPSNVPSSGTVPDPEGVTSPEGVPNLGGVPNSGTVPTARSVPRSGSVPSPEGVPSPGTPRSDLNPGSVPSTEGVPSPEGVPDPGGRCGCRCPPAAPPSPSRDLPCGLGCRHRRPPPDPGDPRRPPQDPGDPRRHRHEAPPGSGQRGSLRAARAGVALCLRLLGALLALLFLLLLLLRSVLRAASAGLRRSRQLLRQRFGRRASGGGGAEEEVTRLVTMAEVAEEELDPFRVLGVEPTATDAELRRAYRRLAVLVHPDKSRDPRAEAAFKVLRAGWERVSSPERRREYQAKQLAQGELARALGAFLGRLQEELRDAMDAMGCTRCGGRHRRFQLDRDPRGGRWCGPCGGWHAADEGDLWAESSLLGLKVTYLARMDGHIYDVTEWAGCQRVAISPDSHRVPYHLSFGARTATPAGRQRAPPKGSPPTPADLQDFLARVFQGNLGPEAGGAFPAPPGAAGPPQGPPQPQGGPPRGDTKHKRRKKGRRPLPR